MRTNDNVEDYYSRFTCSNGQTLYISYADSDVNGGYNITLNYTRTGIIGDIYNILPLNNTQDCSYDTNTDKTFKVSDYANCKFSILSPDSTDQVTYLWTSPKWTYNNLDVVIQDIIQAGGDFFIFHSKTTNIGT